MASVSKFGCEPPHLGRLALGVRQHQDAREPLDRLERQRPLALEVGPAALAAGEQLGVARLGLREPALGAGELLLRPRPPRARSPRRRAGAARSARVRRARLTRSTSARRSLRVSSRNGRERVLVEPGSSLRAGARPRAARPAGSAGAKLPSRPGSWSRGSPSSAISTAKSRSWMTCPSPSTTRAR